MAIPGNQNGIGGPSLLGVNHIWGIPVYLPDDSSSRLPDSGCARRKARVSLTSRAGWEQCCLEFDKMSRIQAIPMQ